MTAPLPIGPAASRGAPLVVPLEPAPAAVDVFQRLAALPHCVFFDSALRDPVLGRHSFVAADPFEFLALPVEGPPALDALALRLAPWQSPTLAGLPPFQGGAAGLISYDLGRQLETLPPPRSEEFRLPALAMGFYDVVAAFDHQTNRAWLISQGWPETDPAARVRRAQARLTEFQNRLRQPAAGTAPTPASGQVFSIGELTPQHPVGQLPGLTSNLSETGYLEAVAACIEYIRAGDIFQVNFAQRLLHPANDATLPLYLRLRQRNPATFAGYLDLGPYQIVSASPERFLQVRGGTVEARPIKGTRQRGTRPEADLFAGDELRESVKDRAENVMIVDLLRNDLSRVCQSDSVCVTQLCQLEVYQFVQHLVSAVRGRLRAGLGALDAWRAAFPGGSITGAPKVRAMQIIAELEPAARGAYCGGLAYLGFDGTLDSSILIRTITAGGGWWQMPVGGGIVAQSDPRREYEETWHKAAGLLRSLAL
jgi:para-aminobenzoate synthetase component 1